MKVAAFTALHYGSDYLRWALRSVAPFVDEWLVAYSPVGSHGSRTNTPCPDREADLRDIAYAALNGVPLKWYTETWQHEGQQRDSVFARTDADLILVVDADEIWRPEAVQEAIRQGRTMKARNGRVPFEHFWRSFGWVCRDAAQPVRVIKPSVANDDHYIALPAPVLHFGYARRPSDIYYKIQIHGHRGEWRQEWFVEKYLAWTPETGPFDDLHPTNHDYWTAKPYTQQLPAVLHDHPFFSAEVIT